MSDLVATFRAALARRPDERFARYSLALELVKAGRPEEALAEFAELLRRHPTSGAGHLQRGRLLAELGRSAEARAAWEDGLAALRGLTDPEARRSTREIADALEGLDG